MPWLLAAALVAGFVSLGNWQLRRADEKQRMLDGVAAAMRHQHAAPVADAQRGDPDGFSWVTATGEFLPSPALLLDNQRSGDQVGVHVYGVFKPDAGLPLLVDLGWLPVPANRVLPSVAIPLGRQDLAGLLAPPPGAGIALGPAYVNEDAPGASQRWLLTRVDLQALSVALHLKLAPRVLRLDPALPLGYARNLDVLPNTLPPERHRGYALQWFGLALATVIVASYLSLRRTPR